MLQILLSWFFIGFIYLTLGSLCMNFLSRYCSIVERYNVVDRLILGLCTLTVILNVISLWFPINETILVVLSVSCVIYWIIQRRMLKTSYYKVRSKLSGLSSLGLFLLLLAFVAIAVMCLWGPLTIDPPFYHYQNILWIEKFGTVPGIGNLEDRFGFNSNIFVHYSLFALSFLFNQPVYIVQAFLIAVILCQLVYESVKSGYEIKRIILLIIYLAFILSIPASIVDSSTDIIPSLLIFYLAYQVILYEGTLKNKAFLYFITSILLVTFKLSVAPFCLVAFFILISQFKEKKYKCMFIFCLGAIMAVFPWLIRNVIVSGYLIYPLSELDFFNFDWKVPESIAVFQKNYIAYYGNDLYSQMVLNGMRDILSLNFTNPIVYVYVETIMMVLGLLSLVIVGFLFMFPRYRKGKNNALILYICLLATILFWLVNARNYRFAYGILSSMIFFVFYLVVPDLKGKFLRIVLKGTVCMVILGFSFFAYRWGVERYMSYLSIFEYKNNQPVETLMIRPLSVNGKKKDALLNEYLGGLMIYMNKEELRKYVDSIPEIEKRYFTTYKMSNTIEIYISTLREGSSYDYFPCVADKESSQAGKFENITNVEPRGTSLSEGFRVKRND